jgi:hypothetical protein
MLVQVRADGLDLLPARIAYRVTIWVPRSKILKRRGVGNMFLDDLTRARISRATRMAFAYAPRTAEMGMDGGE